MQLMNSSFEPGNGTRYDVLFGNYKDPSENDRCMVVWLRKGNAGQVFTWSRGARIGLGYFCEKTGMNYHDAAAILSWVKKSHPEVVGTLWGLDRDVAAYIPDSITESFSTI